jgi:nucleoside-diphosphate-sugar epimerase
MYAYQHQLNITALRFFTVYGPRGRPDMAPYKFIHAISNHIPIQQYGDGTSSRDYTYISDIVSGVIKSLLYHPSRYSIYNLGKGNGTTLNDFVHYVETYVNTTATIQLLPDQPGDVPYTCANITMAQVDLQYQPMVPFTKGIQQTVQWYQQRHLQQEQLLLLSSSSSSSIDGSDIESNSQLRRPNSRRLLQQQQSIERPSAIIEVIPFDDEMMDPVPLVTTAATLHRTHTNGQRKQRHHDRLHGRNRRRLLLQEATMPNVVAPVEGYKKVAISGGISANTFVGRHVIEALLMRGDDVVVIDDGNDDTDDDVDTIITSSHSALSDLQRKFGTDPSSRETTTTTTVGQLSIHLGRRNNSTFLEHVFHQEQPTHVIHFGMDKHMLSTMDDELVRSKIYVQKNVEVLVRLLEVCKRGSKMTSDGTMVLNKPIQNFVITSSDAVYGYEAASTKKEGATSSADSTGSIAGRHRLWKETDRVDYPKSSYGASMKSAELLAYTYHHLYKIPTSILRLFNVYGPHQTLKVNNPSLQLFDELVQMKTNDSLGSLFFDQPTRWDTFDFSTLDYTYIGDIVQGIVSSIDRPYDYEIFNLGSGSSDCLDGIKALIRSIANELSLTSIQKEKILKDFQESMSLQSIHLVDGISCANVQKARDLLKYTPGSTIEQSLSVKRTIDWLYETSSFAPLVEKENLSVPDVAKEENVPIDQMHPRVEPVVVDASGTSLPSNTTMVTVAAADAATNATKLCPTGVIILITNYPNYPQWLRQLAIAQWFMVVIILIFRFTHRLRGNGSGGGTGSAMNRSSSSSNLLSLQQQHQQQQQFMSNNDSNKEARISPRRERVYHSSTQDK